MFQVKLNFKFVSFAIVIYTNTPKLKQDMLYKVHEILFVQLAGPSDITQKAAAADECGPT